MASLGSQARMTARGERNPHVAFDDPIETRAWAIWFVVRNGKVRRAGKPSNGPAERGLEGVAGHEIEVNLMTKMRDTWTELAQLDKPSQATWANDIRTYLRAAGNMICLRSPGIGSGDHGQPLWWVRDEWNDAKIVGLYRTAEMTAAEKRLTPQEAGETRPPAPVTIVNGHDAKQSQKDSNRTVVKNNSDRIIDLVKAAPHPLYQAEICDVLEVNNQDVGRVLRALVTAGKLYRRQESRGERGSDELGRYRFLYWHKPTVPIRKVPLALKGLALEHVAKIKPGEWLRITWMPPRDKVEVQEMVDAGLLVYNEDATHVALAPSNETITKPAVPEPAHKELGKAQPDPPVASKRTPPPATEAGESKLPASTAAAIDAGGAEIASGKPFATLDTVLEIGAAIERLVAAEVEKRTGGLQLETLRQQIEEERAGRSRAEAALIEARAELSAVQRKLTAARDLFTS